MFAVAVNETLATIRCHEAGFPDDAAVASINLVRRTGTFRN
jgi:hypothetical protein